MANGSAKLGYGSVENIDTALTNNVLDANDLVLTSDTSEFVYITDDKQKQFVRPRIRVFDTVVAAVEALNASSDTYAGQIVGVKNATTNKVEEYTVQASAAGWQLEAFKTTVETSLNQVKF